MKKRPHVAIFNPSNLKTPFAPKYVKVAVDDAYIGEVSKDGKWKLEPAAGWRVKLVSTGIYEISHFKCKHNFCLNLSLINEIGTIKHVGTHDMNFVVEIKKEKELVNADFSFSISFLG